MENLKKQSPINSINLPYKEIGDFPRSYSMGNVLKRLIDGLGYRYYWATDSLTESDLSFKPSEDSRSSLETLEHILDISGFILRISRREYNRAPVQKTELNFDQMRQKTLTQLKEASDLFGTIEDEDVQTTEILIKQKDHEFSLPLWYLFNGPLSDAIYHVGQIVLLRRATGNQINPSVDIFTGKNK